MSSANDFGSCGRVILTYGRSLMSLVAAQSLARRGVDVIGCDSVDMTALRFSKFTRRNFTHPDPADDEDAYIARLGEMIERYRPVDDQPYVLMPMFDHIRILARRASELPARILLAAPDHSSISQVYPKDKLVETMKRTPGLGPRSLVIESAADLESAKSLAFPLVMKPAEGVGGRGVEFVDDFEELAEAYGSAMQRHQCAQIVQETAPGEDYCFTAIADQGQVRAAMAYRNLSTFPSKSGAGTVRETVDHAPFMDASRTVLAAAKWHGVAEIDFRWSGEANDPPKLIEVNARFWAGLYHSIASGVDYPWLLYQLTAYGSFAENPAAEIGKVTKTPVLSTLSAVSAISAQTFRFKAARRVIVHGMKQIGEGDIMAGLRTIWRGIAGSIAVDRGAFKAMEEIDAIRTAPSEFDNAHDPFAGLGFLFILSSLLRYGKLPEEVKFKA